jgi:hypothetical protein
MVLVLAACRDPEVAADGGAAESGSSSDAASSGASTSGADESGSSSGETETTGDTDPPPPTPGEGPFGGGARLRAVVESNAEGIRRLLHWYDTELAIECEFVRDDAGELRCLPLTVDGVDVGFTEPACRQGVIRADACTAAPALVRTVVPGAAACDDGPRHLVWRRGAPRVMTASVYRYTPGFGSCTSVGGPPGGSYYDVDVIDSDDFVAAQWVDEPGPGGLIVRALVADDGSYERARLVDPTTGQTCSPSPQPSDDGVQWGCTIDRRAVAGAAFATAACSEPLVTVDDDGTCGVPTVAVDADGGWWELGERHLGEVFVETDDGCMPREAPERELSAFFARGAARDPIAWLPVERVTDPAAETARLQPWSWSAGGDTIALTDGEGLGFFDDPEWYDAAIAAGCSSEALPIGGRACAISTRRLPYPEDVRWGDPECTAIELLWWFDDPPPPQISLMSYDDCGGVLAGARAVVGAYQGPVYRRDPDTAACVIDERADETYLQVGNHVDLDDLPTLERSTLE